MRRRLWGLAPIGVLMVAVPGLAAASPAPAGLAGSQPVRLTAAPTPVHEPTQAVLDVDPAACNQTAREAGTQLAMCPTGPKRPVTAGEVAIDAPIWLPSWCYDQQDARWVNQRFDACTIIWQDWSMVRYPDGVVVGGFTLTEYYYSGTLSYSNGWVLQAGFEMSNAWGDIGGIELHVDGRCFWGTCTWVSSQFPSPQMLSSNPHGTFNFQMDLGYGQVAAAYTQFRYQLLRRDIPPTPIMGVVAPQVRCDNYSEGLIGFGCVFPTNYIPVVSYGRWSELGELARHIQEAQQSGLPGAYPGTGPNTAPLTRLTNPELRELNRARACPDHYPRPAGKSCDEYPFASTWQGAHTSGTTTGARTRDWCQINEPIFDGPYGWSVCMIDEAQNEVGGGRLGNFYNTNRIINGDPFYVLID